MKMGFIATNNSTTHWYPVLGALATSAVGISRLKSSSLVPGNSNAIGGLRARSRGRG